uniref:Uncharacterized protein n=1 Tax=Magallana gigas TaxID=29159 RepID=K1QB80_MAGGI
MEPDSPISSCVTWANWDSKASSLAINIGPPCTVPTFRACLSPAESIYLAVPPPSHPWGRDTSTFPAHPGELNGDERPQSWSFQSDLNPSQATVSLPWAPAKPSGSTTMPPGHPCHSRTRNSSYLDYSTPAFPPLSQDTIKQQCTALPQQ